MRSVARKRPALTSMEQMTDDLPITDSEMRGALARVLASRVFCASKRLCRFLEFTVGRLLDGTAGELKETTIGVQVYDRKTAYEKNEDSIVRTEARRLRNKLTEYYGAEGQNDPIALVLRPGSYIPSFARRRAVKPGAGGFERLATTEFTDPASPRGRTAPVGPEVSIAVLPLADLSGSDFSARCARILTEELVHGWTHVDGIAVVSVETFPSTLFSFHEGKAESPRSEVQVMLTGSVWEEDERLRVIIRAINANRSLIWTQRFEAATGTQGVQTLARRLASALINRLCPEPPESRQEGETLNEKRLASSPTMFEAEALLDEATSGDALHVAITKFQEVSKALPALVRPIYGVANCYSTASLCGVAGSGKLVARASEMAKRAVEMNGNSVMARSTLGWTHMLVWEWNEAESCFQEAIAAGNHVLSLRHYALFLAATERFDEAESFIGKAQYLDLFSGQQKMAYNFFLHLRRRGEELQESVAEEEPSSLPAAVGRLLLACSHVQQDRYDDAKRIALGCRRNVGAQPNLMAQVAEVLALCGDEAQARHIATVFRLFSPASPISHYRQALLSLAFGQRENAWVALERALAEREPELVWLKVEPRLDVLRGDTRFANLLAQVMPPPREVTAD